jgi:hypothetical protein
VGVKLCILEVRHHRVIVHVKNNNKMSSFVEKYKKWLAVILGHVCLLIGLYAPALSALLITDDNMHWGLNNTVFTGLGIIFLWGEIIAFAKIVQNTLGSLGNKKK